MCLSADLDAETYGLTRSKELGARIFIPLHAGLIFIPRRFNFQGDFDRVTIDQLILLFTSLLLSFDRSGNKNGLNFVETMIIHIKVRFFISMICFFLFRGLRCGCLQILVWNLLD